jgi:hypothetical protein
VETTITMVIRCSKEYIADGVGYVFAVVHVVCQLSVNIYDVKAMDFLMLNAMQEFILHSDEAA